MLYFLLGLLALAIVLVLSRRFVAADVKKLANNLRVTGGVFCALLALLLLAVGRVAFAIPLAWLAIILFRQAYSSPRVYGATGQASEVRTEYLHMVLDHDTGDMAGIILKGRWQGQSLRDLTDARLIDLWRECAENDRQSEQLMSAYLDRNVADWRDHVQGEEAAASGQQPPSGGPMGLDEAYKILGLRPGVSADDINRAHRALMKQFHPDQGGSNYLATKINEAKEVLLKAL